MSAAAPATRVCRLNFPGYRSVPARVCVWSHSRPRPPPPAPGQRRRGINHHVKLQNAARLSLSLSLSRCHSGITGLSSCVTDDVAISRHLVARFTYLLRTRWCCDCYPRSQNVMFHCILSLPHQCVFGFPKYSVKGIELYCRATILAHNDDAEASWCAYDFGFRRSTVTRSYSARRRVGMGCALFCQ